MGADWSTEIGKYTMQLSDLFEGVGERSVYHGTFTGRAVKIIQTGAILPNTKHDASQLMLSPEKQLVKGVSTSRNLLFALYYATGAVFEFDLTALKQRYRVIPVDFYSYRPEGRVRKSARSEAEEFIVSNSAIPLKPYLRAIHVLQRRFDAIADDPAMAALANHPLVKIVSERRLG